MGRPATKFILMLLLCWLGSATAVAQSHRVATPDWSQIDTSDVFYANAFEQALQGERPIHLSARPTIATTTAPSPPPAPVAAGSSWSGLISSEAIEDEIKRLSRQLETTVTQPVPFAGRGYQAARQQFSMLATWFAIVHEYDGDIRWKASATAARDRFAYTASIAKVGTIQVFKAAKTSKDVLGDLIRGNPLAAEPGDRETWTDLLNRSPLMLRLEESHQGVIEPGLASETEMKAKRDELIHEAQIAAAIGHMLLHDGMEESDDEQYMEYCAELKRGAESVIRAVQKNDYGAAVQGSGVISKSCSICHETYRG